MNRKSLEKEERIAIAISLLPALAIVGASFWHAFLTGASADYEYALTGITLMTVIAVAIYLPFMTTKVSYGYGYEPVHGALLQFFGGTIFLMFFSMFQLGATGWANPVTIVAGWILVSVIAGFFCLTLNAKG